jgi:hypothetical protein
MIVIDFVKPFQVLQLLVKADYQSEQFTFIGETNDMLRFIDKRTKSVYTVKNRGGSILFSDGIISALDEFILLTGHLDKIRDIERLLESPTYIGCKICEDYASCYFKKYEKTYELRLDDACELRVYTGESVIKYDEFIDIILHSTNTKSARN